MPWSASAGMIGSVPPERVRIGRTPKAASNASCAILITGEPAATTIDEAERMLGDAVAVYLDAGISPGGVASTILDVTAPTPRILRDGPVGLDVLHRFNNTIEAVSESRA